MATLTSKLIVELIDRASGPSRAVAAAIGRLSAMQARNNAALARSQGQMLGAVAAAYGLAKAIGAPLKAATEFESKLEDIGQKIDIPVAGLPKLGTELRGIARQTTQSASEIAEGMDILAGKGAKREDALAMLPAIGRAATAYRAEVKDLADAGFSALDNLKIPAVQFAKALDVMAVAGKAGAFELKDMAREFPALTAAAHALKIDGVDGVAKLSAALQIARKGAGSSSEAATNVNNLMQKIVSPETTKKFKKAGIDIRKELKKVQKEGGDVFEWISGAVKRATKGDFSKLGDFFQDAQVQQFLRPLLDNLKEYRKIRDEAFAAQGVVEEDYQRRLKTGAMAIKRFHIAIENINLAIGAALLPGLNKLADVLVPIANRMAEFAEKNPALTSNVVALAAGLVGLRIAGFAAMFGLRWMWGGALVLAIGSMRALGLAVSVASFALLPFGAAFRAVGAAIVATRSAIIAFAAVSALIGTGGALRMAAASILSLAGAFNILKFALIGTGVGAILVGLGVAGLAIYENWSKIKEVFSGLGAALMSAIAPLNLSKEAWQSLGSTISSAIGSAVDYVIGKVQALASLLASIPGKIASMVGMGGGKSPPTAPAVAGARAAGGPVRGGSTYLVGERGPELFRSATSGRISNTLDTVRSLKAGSGGGGRSVNNTVSINVQAAPGQSPEAIASAVERRMSEKLNALSRGAFSDGVY